MVLSGPEAAALLAQAGITCGEQEQQQMEEMVAEEGSILAPEGSTVGDDGSIIAADGTILAPPGTVMIGEDGTLMMAENSALLSQEGNFVGEVEKGEGGEALQGGGNVFTTADGDILRAGEDNVLTDADGNVLTDQDGNILTTADIGALTQDGNIMASVEETGLAEAGGEVPMTEGSDEKLSDQPGQEDILTTSDGNVITSDGNFLTSDGNIIKPEEAQKLLASQGVSLLESESDNRDEVMDSETSELLQQENVENEVNINEVAKPESSDMTPDTLSPPTNEDLVTPADNVDEQMLMDVDPNSKQEEVFEGHMQENRQPEPEKPNELKPDEGEGIIVNSMPTIEAEETSKSETDQLAGALVEGDPVGDVLTNIAPEGNTIPEAESVGDALIEDEPALVGEDAMESMPTLEGVTEGKEIESADGTAASTAEGAAVPSADGGVSSADGGEKSLEETIAEATAVPSEEIAL